jgi:regulator of Ty1 transposition protein 103
MASFDKAAMADKLAKVNSSQGSIETISTYCLFQRKKCAAIVALWAAQLSKSSAQQKLALLYVANDIIQKSRKKGPEYTNEFYRVMARALRATLKGADEKLQGRVARIVNIWQERGIFGSHLAELRGQLGDLLPPPPAAVKQKAAQGGATGTPAAGAAAEGAEAGQAAPGESEHVAAVVAAAAAVDSARVGDEEQARITTVLEPALEAPTTSKCAKASEAVQAFKAKLEALLEAQTAYDAALEAALKASKEAAEAHRGDLANAEEALEALQAAADGEVPSDDDGQPDPKRQRAE